MNPEEQFINRVKLAAIRGTVSLSRVCLEGADLSAVNLIKANLGRISLCGANLDNADLTEARLRGLLILMHTSLKSNPNKIEISDETIYD